MKTYVTRYPVWALFAALLLAAHAPGQELWEKKPYQKWSEEEARKVLTSSPWVRTHTFSQAIIQPLQSPGLSRPTPSDTNILDMRVSDPSAREDVGRARQARPELKYTAQFRSALPLRQAIVRLGQISAKYETLTPDQKQTFDRDSELFLKKDFAETIVVHVSYGSNVPIDDRELAFHWQAQTTDTLKNFVFLIRGNGEKVPIIAYVVSKGAGREFQFVFPRAVEGRPVIQRGDKSVQLEFPHPKIRDQKEARVLLSFNPEKMVLNGEIAY